MKQIEKWGNVDKYPNRVTDATSRMRPTAKSGVFCAGRAFRKLAYGMFLRCKKFGQSPAHPASPGVCKIARGAGSGKKPPRAA